MDVSKFGDLIVWQVGHTPAVKTIRWHCCRRARFNCQNR